MQDLDAFKYFLFNLALHNVVLVLLAAGLGVLLGRLLWIRANQGVGQLRERLTEESARAREAERAMGEAERKFESLRAKVESAEGGAVVMDSLELEVEVKELRSRVVAADQTLQKMIEANGALEAAVRGLEEEKAGWEQRETTGLENEEAGLAALRAEFEASRGEAGAVRAERDELVAELAELKERLAAAERAKKGKKDPAAMERVAELEMQLLDARRERRQVEEASGVLRKELYGMRHKLEEMEQREAREKELEEILKEAEQRLGRLQAEAAKRARQRAEEMAEMTAATEKAAATDPVQDDGEGPVVRLEVGDGDDGGKEEDRKESPEAGAGKKSDDLTRIRGVGKALEQRLNEAGMTSLAQIAGWSDRDCEGLSAKLGLKNAERLMDWRRQARELVRKGTEGEA